MNTWRTALAPVRMLQAAGWILPVLALGPIWLVTRDFWDGIIGTHAIERGDFSGMRHWLIPSNWGLAYLLLRAMGLLTSLLDIPPWLWGKLLITASVLGLAREARLLCSQVLGWNDRDARFAGLLAVCFPCWYVLYGNTFIYLVFIWMTLAGHRLLHGESATRAAWGYLLVLLSFQVHSNLVAVFALEAVRWLCVPEGRARQRPRALLMMATAVLTYAALRLVWPPAHHYQGYNNLVSPFSWQGARSWVRAAAMLLTWVPLLLLPAAVAWLAAGRPRACSAAKAQALPILVLLAGSAFAYLAVGKGAPLFIIALPDGALGTGAHLGRPASSVFFTPAHGWSMRNAFLFSVPAAIASVWLFRLATAGQPAWRATLGAWHVAFGVAVIANLGWLAEGHAAKQLRAAQELSVVRGLGELQAPPAGRLDLELAQRVGWTSTALEANYLLWMAYGRTDWAGALYGPDEGSQQAALAEREDTLDAPAPRIHHLMDGLVLPGCSTGYAVTLPEGLAAWAMAADRLGVRPVPPAHIAPRHRSCVPCGTGTPGSPPGGCSLGDEADEAPPACGDNRDHESQRRLSRCSAQPAPANAP